MDENELALKIAEITLDSKKANILADMFKVGIPSIVAIVSSFIAYKISIKSSNVSREVAHLSKSFDEKIEKIKYENEKKKRTSERRIKLIEDMTEHVSIIYDSFHKYLRTIRGKLHLIKNNKPVSSLLEEMVVKEYSSAATVLQEHQHKAEVLAQLIGKEEIINNYVDFREAINNSLADYAHDCTEDYASLINHEKKLKEISQTLFNSLSQLYLTLE